MIPKWKSTGGILQKVEVIGQESRRKLNEHFNPTSRRLSRSPNAFLAGLKVVKSFQISVLSCQVSFPRKMQRLPWHNHAEAETNPTSNKTFTVSKFTCSSPSFLLYPQAFPDNIIVFSVCLLVILSTPRIAQEPDLCKHLVLKILKVTLEENASNNVSSIPRLISVVRSALLNEKQPTGYLWGTLFDAKIYSSSFNPIYLSKLLRVNTN